MLVSNGYPWYNPRNDCAGRAASTATGSTTYKEVTAMPNNTIDSNKYHGNTCKECGDTLRYKKGHKCITCHAIRRKQWKKNNHEKVLAGRRKHNAKPETKIRMRKYSQEYRRKNPNKKGFKVPKIRQVAMSKVRREVILNNIPPASEMTCADCGKTAKHYHHKDYLKPLDIVPLCVSCHLYRHSPYPK